MSVPTSTSGPVRSYLLTQIKAACPDPIYVCLDEPTNQEPQDIISIGDVTLTWQPLAFVGSGGSGWLLEDYTVDITVSSFRGGDDAAGTYDAAQALVDAVATVVRNDPSLGGLVVQAIPFGCSYKSSFEAQHKGRLVEAVITVRVEARS